MISCTILDAYQLLQKGAETLAQIEANGIRVDVPRLERVIRKTEEKAKVIEEELKADEIFKGWRNKFGNKSNLGSDTQLGHVIYNQLNYPCSHWTSGGKGGKGKSKPSVSEKALQDVDLPFVKRLFEARHLRKTVASFLKGIQRETIDGFLRPSFNLNTAVSYRSSSDSPNFQALPRRDEKMAKLVRHCIIPRKGRHFWEIDFKGIEVGINACYNKDPVLIEYVKTDPGRMHKDAACELFLIKPEQVIKRVRDRAKNQFVFASFYGSYYIQTARGLWDDICRDKALTVGEGGTHVKEYLASKGIIELGDCNPKQSPRSGTFEGHVKKVEEALWERFSVYAEWRDQWWADYLKKGYFNTLTGFRVDWGKGEGGGGILTKNDSISYPAQGSAFHCLLKFLIILQKWLTKYKMKTKIVGQIHDSAEGDSPPNEIQDVLEKAEEIVREDLPRIWPWIIVPLQIEIEVSDVDQSWYSKKPWARRNGVWGPTED